MFFWHQKEEIYNPSPRPVESSQTTGPAPVRTEVPLEDLWSSDELVRLETLRERMLIGGACREFGLDERRLGFARWLIVNGRIDEGW